MHFTDIPETGELKLYTTKLVLLYLSGFDLRVWPEFLSRLHSHFCSVYYFFLLPRKTFFQLMTFLTIKQKGRMPLFSLVKKKKNNPKQQTNQPKPKQNDPKPPENPQEKKPQTTHLSLYCQLLFQCGKVILSVLYRQKYK